MNAEQAIKMLGELGARPQFAHFQMNLEGAARSWIADLGDLPGGEVAGAVNALVRTRDGFPTVAAVRRHIAERRGLLPPAPDLAWALLLLAAPGAAGVHPLVWSTADMLGGMRHVREKNLRWEFTQAYGPLHERAVGDILAADGLTPTGDRALPAAAPAEHVWRDDGDLGVYHLRPSGCGGHHAPGHIGQGNDCDEIAPRVS